MTDFEQHNLDAINSLNQRGGRMLSLIDLLEADTLNLDMAAAMAAAAAGGGSFLTGAGPGGVGKTTLMAAALAFLPPGTEIVTIEGPETLNELAARPAPHPQCLVVHEIGAGSYYGYLWGPAVARYFNLASQPGRCLASNLHAETYTAARHQLMGGSLGVPAQTLARVSLLAFMTQVGSRRRIATLWESSAAPAADKAPGAVENTATPHRLAWRWVAEKDAFEKVGPAAGESDALSARIRDFLDSACRDHIRRLEDLRRLAVAELFSGR
jgi:ABC-type cobalamin/Fe3+-siderophores transport system ATPase subunit